MYDIFYNHLEEKIKLSNKDKEVLQTFFKPVHLVKKQLLLVEGNVCRQLAFVTKGLLKAYHTDEKGNEHINQFSPEGWWTSDMNSYLSGEVSFYSIDAIEDSEVLLLASEEFENLITMVTAMERYFRLLFQNSLITKERRLISSYTHTAEEKYRYMLQSNPDLIARLPQNLLASYLGISPETLSRLKKHLISGR